MTASQVGGGGGVLHICIWVIWICVAVRGLQAV